MKDLPADSMTLRQVIREAVFAGDWHSVACAQRVIGLEYVGDGFGGSISIEEMDFARNKTRGEALDWLETEMKWKVQL